MFLFSAKAGIGDPCLSTEVKEVRAETHSLSRASLSQAVSAPFSLGTELQGSALEERSSKEQDLWGK